MVVGDLVQFNENHKWRGCIGIITEKKEIHNEDLNSDGLNDFRFMVSVPIPQKVQLIYLY